MCRLCAAFSATTLRCSACARFNSARWRWTAALNEATCCTMLASCWEVELTASILFSRSSKLVEPRRTESVELSWVEV